MEEHFFIARINAEIAFTPPGGDSCLVSCFMDPSDSFVWQATVGDSPVQITVRRCATYDLAFQASPGRNSAFIENLNIRRDTLLGTITLHGRDTEYIIDNLDPECFFSGPWAGSEYIQSYWGLGYAWANGAAPASALFLPEAIIPGTYQVFIRYTSASNRAKDVPVRVHHAGGDTLVIVDQTTGGGEWLLLCEFDLAPGSYIQVSNNISDTTRVVIADAVCFTRNDAGLVDDGEKPGLSLSYDPRSRTILAESPWPTVLSLYDVSGRTVKQERFSERLTISLVNLPRGSISR